MEGDLRRAAGYAGMYTLRIVVLVVVVVALAWLLLDMFLRTLPDGVSADTLDILTRALGYVPVILPVIPLAFVAGYFAPGTVHRLAARLVLNVFLVFVTLFLTSDLMFSMEGLVLSSSPDVTADHIALSMDASAVGYILLLIPACSIVDAVLEYRSSGNDE